MTPPFQPAAFRDVGPCIPGHPALCRWLRDRLGLPRIFLGLVSILAALSGRADVGVIAWGSGNGTNMPTGLTNVVSVSAGSSHAVALRTDGTVVAWGIGVTGQTNVPPGLTNVIAVSCGGNHTLALRGDGSVVAWGANGSQQTNVPAGLSNVIAVAGGLNHSLALKADGTVTAWGLNTSGQATAPGGATNVVAISAGGNHSMALRGDGGLVVWGSNGSGQRTVPASLSNAVAIAVAAGQNHSVALRQDGTVVAWGSISSQQTSVPANLTNAVGITAGLNHSLALRSDGTLVAWGLTTSGQSTIPSGLTNVVAMAGGDAFSLALSGTLAPFLARPVLPHAIIFGFDKTLTAPAFGSRPLSYQWKRGGIDVPGATNAVFVLTNVASGDGAIYSVSVSNAFGTAASAEALLTVVPLIFDSHPQSQTVFRGATVNLGASIRSALPLSYQWQVDGSALAGVATNPLVFVDVGLARAGTYTLIANNDAGSVASLPGTLKVVPVAAWGDNTFGQTNVPSGLGDIVAVSGGTSHSIALQTDGRVVVWGSGSATNVPPGLTSVVAVAAGGSHSVAVRADGSVIAWGGGPATNVPAALSNVLTVAAGENHGIALRADGTVAAWGVNANGEAAVPSGLSNVVAIAAGGSNSLALRVDGTIAAWGAGPATNVPAGLGVIMALATGGGHGVAVRTNGTVVAWGDNSFGQTNVPAGLTNVVAVAAGGNHTLALRADGSWLGWGKGTNGQTNAVAGLTNVAAIAAGGNHSLAIPGGILPFLTRTIPGQTVPFGLGAKFTANFLASPPVLFQWQLNGTNLAGATAKTLVLTNLVLSQSGTYSVIVSNRFGTIASPGSVLNVVPLIFEKDLQSQTIFLGGSVFMSVSSQSVLPVTYQWRLSATNLPGVTGDSLTLTNLAYGQAGSYTVVASNGAGTVVSAKGVLAVVPLAAWGRNSNGTTTVPGGLSNVVAVAGGNTHTLALRSDGTVAAWGGGPATNVPAGLGNIMAIASGPHHVLALRTNGIVTAWGSNTFGQATVPPGLTNAAALACGDFHGLALKLDGSVVAWGLHTSGQTNVPATLSNVVALAAGRDFSIALRADGLPVAWGGNTWGQTNIPPGLSNVVAVAAAASRVLALRNDGTVSAWGQFAQADLDVSSGLSNVVALSVGEDCNLALRGDGMVVSWGDNSSGQTNVPSWVTRVGGIGSGSAHNLAAPAIGAPFVTTRLATRRAAPGDTVFFRVEANGEQPLRYQWRFKGLELPGRTNAILQLANIGLGDEGDYSVMVSNSLGVANVASGRLLVPKPVFQTVLDNNLVWSTGGTNVWFGTSAPTHDGLGAAQSGSITNSQETWLQTSVNGPGRLTFWRKISSEPDYDFLELYIDGVLQPGRISGEVDWQKQTNTIPAGTHTLRWRYQKDIADSGGADAAWLDEVVFTGLVPFQQAGEGGTSVSNGFFSVKLLGSAGSVLVLENSLNLVDWFPLRTNLVPAGGLEFSIPIGTNDQQFFRAWSEP